MTMGERSGSPVVFFMWSGVVLIQSMMMAAMLAIGAPDSPGLAARVPADAMAVYFGQPMPQSETSGSRSAAKNGDPAGAAAQSDQLAIMLMTLKSAGMVPEAGRMWVDLVTSLPVLSRHPHAAVLLDVTAREMAPEVYRLNDLQAALVIDSGGLTHDIDGRIRDLLRTYSNADDGRIEKIERDGRVHHRLVDQRLPGWTAIEWGELDGCVLVTVGQGAYARMVRAIAGDGETLDATGWFRDAARRLRLPVCTLGIYVDLARLEKRLGEFVDERAANVREAMQLDDVERFLWVFGVEDRALRSDVWIRGENGRDRFVRLTGPGVAHPSVEAAIPEDSPGYAVFRMPLMRSVERWRHALLQSKSSYGRQMMVRAWEKLEARYGFNANEGIVAHLGEHLVIQPYPRHPLGLPLLSLWIEIDPAHREQVARTLDGIMSAWRDHVNPAHKQTPSRFTLQPRIDRTQDGLWYLQLGLVGPAIGLSERWMVVSYSPQAVRVNLEHLQSEHARRPDLTPSPPPAE